MKSCPKGDPVKMIWLNYFNKELLRKKIISVQDYRRMQQMIYKACK